MTIVKIKRHCEDCVHYYANTDPYKSTQHLCKHINNRNYNSVIEKEKYVYKQSANEKNFNRKCNDFEQKKSLITNFLNFFGGFDE